MYYMMILRHEEDKVQKLNEVSKGMSYYIVFYLTLTLIMSVLDYFKRLFLYQNPDGHGPEKHLPVTVTYM